MPVVFLSYGEAWEYFVVQHDTSCTCKNKKPPPPTPAAQYGFFSPENRNPLAAAVKFGASGSSVGTRVSSPVKLEPSLGTLSCPA